MYFITFLCIVIAFACIIAVAWGLTNAITKWDDKRKIERGKKFNKEWDEKMRRFVHNSLYDNKLSKVEDVEYEDVSNQKLLED